MRAHIRFQQGTEPVPSASAVSDVTACPASPIADRPSAPPSPTSSPPPVSNSSRLFTRCQPLYASYCTALLCFSSSCLVRWNMFYFLCLFFTYHLCEKHGKPITLQCYTANSVSWVPKLTILDLHIEFVNALMEWNSFLCCRGWLL